MQHTLGTVKKKKIYIQHSEYCSSRSHSYRNPDSFLILYNSFDFVKDEIENIYGVRETHDDCPIIVIGNKIDSNEERKISYEQRNRIS